MYVPYVCSSIQSKLPELLISNEKTPLCSWGESALSIFFPVSLALGCIIREKMSPKKKMQTPAQLIAKTCYFFKFPHSTPVDWGLQAVALASDHSP